MKLLNKSALAVALFAASQAASANQWSIGVFGGASSVDDLDELCRSAVSSANISLIVNRAPFRLGCGAVDDSDTVKGINLGYKFNEIYGVEVGYVDLGEYGFDITAPVGSTSLTFDAQGAFVVLTGSVNLSDKLSFTGRIGGASLSGDANSSGFTSSSIEIEEDTVAVGGVSFDYAATDNITLELRYDNFDLTDSFGLGLKFGF